MHARRTFRLSWPVFMLLLCGCGKKEALPTTETKQHTAVELPELPDSGSSPPQGSLALPGTFERHTGDLDEMLLRHRIRALIVYGRSGFFYDKGRPRGISYEAVEEFQNFLNKKLKTGKLKVSVNFVPIRPEQLEQALTQGIGDLIATGVVVTPARQQRVAPNQCFGNVELIVAKDVGQETVQYVSNIYKYYVAYKLTQEQAGLQGKSRVF
jgi:hypothetical protein